MEKLKFQETLNLLIQKNGIQKKDLALIIGVSASTLVKWTIYESYPSFEKLLALADYFNVSVDYLMTGKKELGNNDQSELISKFKILNEYEKTQVEKYIDFLIFSR